MVSSISVRDDQGHVWSFLQLDPMLLRDVLRAGIQRWQMDRRVAHHPQAEPSVKLWARCLRSCVGSNNATLKNPKMAGALRSLWSNSLWPKTRSFTVGKATDTICRGCAQEEEYIGHICFKCEAIYSRVLEDEECHHMPEELQEFRDSIMKHGTVNKPQVEIDSFETSVGMPQVPGDWAYGDVDSPVYVWGNWDGDPLDWPVEVFTDGSAGLPAYQSYDEVVGLVFKCLKEVFEFGHCMAGYLEFIKR